MPDRGQLCGLASPALPAARRSADTGGCVERRGHGRLAGEMFREASAAYGVTTGGFFMKPHCLRIFWPFTPMTKVTKRCASFGILVLVVRAIG